MLGTGLEFSAGGGRGGEYRVCQPGKSRTGHHHHHHNQHTDQLRRAQSDIIPAARNQSVKEKLEKQPLDRKPEYRIALQESPKPVSVPPSEHVISPLSNLERFLESITPSVPAQYLSKTTMRGWRTCDVEFQPYFVLGDLWEAFKEWSAYGAGVPVILNDSDSVIQYYVPYLSGIQIYGESTKTCFKTRRPGEDSDSDFKDSSSDGSSDCEPERGLKCPREQWNHYHLSNECPLRMNRLSMRDRYNSHQEDSSSDDGETINSQGCLLFEYLERDPPYSREPLADKISDLASHFPGLKTLRSCDLLSSSWVSVAWYPIYRIPTGQTLKDLNACFLTYHYLHTPLGGAQTAHAPVMTYPSEMDGVPKMSLPVFGLASYKFKGPLWTPSGGSEQQLADFLLQAADDWLRAVQVVPDEYDEKTYCVYTTGASTVYGLGAFGLLLISQTVVTGVTRCLCCGKGLLSGKSSTALAIFFFVLSWVSFLGAEACFLAGSARNAYHTKYGGIFGGEHLTCATLRKGVFAAAAALTLLSMLGSILYYWSHSRADTGGWEKHQNKGVGTTASSYPQQQVGEFEKV